MYLKLDKRLAHSGLNILLELAMQLRKYVWILQVIVWEKCMSNLTDKFVPGITLFMQLSVLLGWQEIQMSQFNWQLVLEHREGWNCEQVYPW